MKPSYQSDRVTLYCARCEDVPSLLADVLVSDPPYGIDGGSGGDAKEYAKANYTGVFEDSRRYVQEVCAPMIETCLQIVSAGAITPGIRCLRCYPVPRDMGCFWTPAAATHGPWGMTTFQPILYYGKDWRAGCGALPTGRQVTEKAPKNGHPCPKPLRAWTWLVDKVAAPGATVLDPFMGSGTTGVAAVQLGRRFIGIECDPTYYAIAEHRIRQAEQDAKLFEPPSESAMKPADLFATASE